MTTKIYSLSHPITKDIRYKGTKRSKESTIKRLLTLKRKKEEELIYPLNEQSI